MEQHGEQQIVPYGSHGDALDDISMNGSNGEGLAVSPIVIQPGDREGPSQDMPNRMFYMHEPRFHWNIMNVHGVVDNPARAAIERIAREAYNFGQQTEQCENRLAAGQIEAEQRIVSLEAEIAGLRHQMSKQRRDHDKLQQDFNALTGKLDTSFALLGQRITSEKSATEQTLRAEIEQQLELKSLSLENRMHVMITEAGKDLRDDIMKAVADLMTAHMLPLIEKQEVTDTAIEELEELKEQLNTLTEKVDNQYAFFQATLETREIPSIAANTSTPRASGSGDSIPPMADSVRSVPPISRLPLNLLEDDPEKEVKPQIAHMVIPTPPAFSATTSGGPRPFRMPTPIVPPPTPLPRATPVVPPTSLMGALKLEPPARFSGKGVPGAAQWLVEMED